MKICTIEGCGKKLTAKGFCQMHYLRLKRNGSPYIVKAGQGYISQNGYRRHYKPNHPLANASDGKLYEHRAVLYDAIGEGTHTCHWCPTQLTWMTNGNPRTPGYLTVDHLDWNKQNNQLDNLVPSCLKCNAERQLKAQSK